MASWQRGRPGGGHSRGAAYTPLRLDCGRNLLGGDLAGSVPPTGSTAGGALVSPTPLQGGVLEASTRLPVELYHSPLEGESQKPSRMAKADAVGGKARLRFVRRRGRYRAKQRCSRQVRLKALGGVCFPGRRQSGEPTRVLARASPPRSSRLRRRLPAESGFSDPRPRRCGS